VGERQDTGGLTALLGVLGARGGLVGADGEQVDLFEAEGAALPLPLKGASGPKGGRPAGSRNRSTEDWARYMLGRYRSPLTMLAELYSRDVAELHGQLQDMADNHTRRKVHASGAVEEVRVLVDPLAVLKLQRDAAVALAPYLHKQQPKAIEIEDKPRGVLIMGEIEAADAVGDGLALPLAPIEENQRVTKAASVASDNPSVGHDGKANGANGLAFDDV
jgi:hypothetical protein